jgi:hypothetical protein
MRRILELRPSRRPLERPTRMAARIPARCAQGAGERDERRQPGFWRPRPARRPGGRARGRGRRGGRAAAVPCAAGRRGRGAGWPGRPRRAWPAGQASGGSGAFSSDQRVPLTQRPIGGVRAVVVVHSSRRTWSVPATPADRHGRGRNRPPPAGSPRGWRAGTRRSCRSRRPGSTACGRPASGVSRAKAPPAGEVLSRAGDPASDFHAVLRGLLVGVEGVGDPTLRAERAPGIQSGGPRVSATPTGPGAAVLRPPCR